MAAKFAQGPGARARGGEGGHRRRARRRPRPRPAAGVAPVRLAVRHRGPHDRHDVVHRERPGQGGVRVSAPAEQPSPSRTRTRAPRRSRRPGTTPSWPTSCTTTGRPAPTTRSGRSRSTSGASTTPATGSSHVAGTDGWPYAHVARAGLRHRLLHAEPQARRRDRRGARHRPQPRHGRGGAAQRARPRLRGRGPGRRRRAAALRRRHVRPRHRARGAAPHPRPRSGASREILRVLKPGGRFVFAGEPTRHGDFVARRLSRLHLVGGHPAHPAAGAGGVAPPAGGARRVVAGGRARGGRRPAHVRSRPSSRRWPRRAGAADVRVATSELLASWFGWPVRTFECAVPQDKLGLRWANFALHGWQRLRRVDARLEGVVPAGCSTTPRSPAEALTVVADRPVRPRRDAVATPRRASSAALRHAFAVNGLPPLDADTERSLLGPPFYDSLPPLVGGRNGCRPVIDAYREHYVGRRDVRHHLLRRGARGAAPRCAAAACRLAVATSKPEPHAVPIVEHLGLAGFFDDRRRRQLGRLAPPRRW